VDNDSAEVVGYQNDECKRTVSVMLAAEAGFAVAWSVCPSVIHVSFQSLMEGG